MSGGTRRPAAGAVAPRGALRLLRTDADFRDAIAEHATARTLQRPVAPDLGPGELSPAFVVDRAVIPWARAIFYGDAPVLWVPELRHLRDARVGVLWTNVEHARQMRRVLATCELPVMMGGKWKVARHDQQIAEWFGTPAPDFLITLSTELAAVSDRTFAAVILHELLHAGQAKDAHGFPKFSATTGLPVWAIRGHDVEEFVTVARLFGAVSPEVAELAEAITAGPLVSDAAVAGLCGTCARGVG